ncbi:hypothetical protein AB0E27_24945 [Streptomyces sparsogenes]|uniref:hypothetical protein n=1 Tax=Streptomyces sparsogenes TaxID=67365 RepID=UPI0033E6E61D
MTRLAVAAAFGYTITSSNPVWTDITGFVDFGAGVSITRGAADELSDIQAGTCSLTLSDADGRFTPGRTGSPYYPNVKKNTPIRVLVTTATKNLVTNPSFETDVADWFSNFSRPTRARSTTRAQNGTASMLLTWTDFSPLYAYTRLHGLNIGVTHTASAYVWVPAGAPAVRLEIAGVATGAASTLNDTWERLTLTFTSTLASHDLRISAVGTPVDGTQTWVDAVQVEEGASATAFDPAGAQVHGRFWGMVNEWPISWDGLYAKAQVTATDPFKWLSRRALQPMLSEEILLDGPLVYYPLAEPADSTTAGDLSGTAATPLAITQVGSGGSLVFAEGTGPAATGQACPAFTPASSSAGRILTCDLGPDFASLGASGFLCVEAWFSTSTTSRALLGLTSLDDQYQLVLALSATGALTVEYTQYGAPLNVSTVSTGNLADGGVHQVVYDELNGVYVDGTFIGRTSADVMSDLRLLSVGGFKNTRLWSGSIAHIALYRSNNGLGAAAAAHYAAGTAGYAGETADARIARLGSYARITNITAQGAVFNAIASQGELGRSALEHLQDVERTESGHLAAARDRLGLVFQSRDVRYNPVPAFSLDYADTDTSGVEFSDDDQKITNTVVASRPGGATQRVVDTVSRATYGPYERSLDLLKTADAEVVAAANWLVSRYADPPPELREVAVEGYSLGTTTYRQLLTADISTTFDLTGLPDQAPATTQTITVEGYTETIQNQQHRFGFHVSRAQTDTVWVLGNAVYSVLGQTTRLAY